MHFLVSILARPIPVLDGPHAATPPDTDGGDVAFASHENTHDKTAACSACLAGVTAWVYTSNVDRRVECRNSSCITLNSVPTLLSSVEYV